MPSRKCLYVALFLALFIFCAPAFAQEPHAAHDVIVLTDAGCDVDDQFVISHVVLSPRFHVHAIISSHAPNLASNGLRTTGARGETLPTAEVTAGVVREVLAEMAPAKLPPVFVGSSIPLQNRYHARMNDGVQKIIDESKKFDSKHRLTMVVLGPATDLASALIADDDLQDRIDVVALAFDSWPHGGDSFNVANDVLAWQLVFESTAPITIADGVVTKRDLAMGKMLADRVCDSRGRLGKYLDALVIHWLDRLPQLAQQTTGELAWPIWDEATVAYLLGYTKSETHPRPVLRDDTRFDQDTLSTKRTLNWITSIDHDALWRDLTAQLDKAAKPAPASGTHAAAKAPVDNHPTNKPGLKEIGASK